VEHIAPIEKRDGAQNATQRNADLGIQDDNAMAAPRKPRLVDGLRRAKPFVHEPPDRGVASGVEPLARRDVIDDDRVAVLDDLPREARCNPHTRPQRENRRVRTPQGPERKCLKEGLEISNLRTEGACRQLGVAANQTPRGRIHEVVACVANERR
jgi:hypothetical protein